MGREQMYYSPMYYQPIGTLYHTSLNAYVTQRALKYSDGIQKEEDCRNMEGI